MALLKDGTVWTWGYNAYGQLGDGTRTGRTTPVQVLGENGDDFLTRIVAISAGELHSMALRADGRVFAWGYNGTGALGNNSHDDSFVPASVADDTPSQFLENVVSIAAGSRFSLAVKQDGSVVSWGSNNAGVLGINLSNDGYHGLEPVPVHGVNNVGFLTGCVSVAAGLYHGSALRTDGTVVSWGNNTNGSLGDNTLVQRLYPVQSILSTNNVYAISSMASAGHKMALRSDGVLRVQVQLDNAMSLGTELHIELRPVGGGTTILETVNAGTAGVIALTSIPAGTYNVAIKGKKWLQQVVPNVSTLGGVNVLNLRFNLRGGDCNNDNVVDIFDLLILIRAYNSLAGGTNFNGRGDFNGDNRVDIVDLLTLIRNYNVRGDQ